jgi:hypothetical protein
MTDKEQAAGKKKVAFHRRRARTHAGSHPVGIVVAKRKSDNSADHLLSRSERRYTQRSED